MTDERRSHDTLPDGCSWWIVSTIYMIHLVCVDSTGSAWRWSQTWKQHGHPPEWVDDSGWVEDLRMTVSYRLGAPHHLNVDGYCWELSTEQENRRRIEVRRAAHRRAP